MEYNRYIDHTLLKPDCKSEDIEKLCQEALDNHFWSVCVNPGFVKMCANKLNGSDVKVCTVIGFPLGATSSESKAFEAEQAVKDGANELDMVINISRLRDGDYDYVQKDIESVVNASNGNLVKVIIETCLLTNEQKIKACQLAVAAGANFVKTSTGFSTGGATVEDISLMRKTVGPNIGVKASGGVKTHIDMIKMIEAGASRIGTSNGVLLMKK